MIEYDYGRNASLDSLLENINETVSRGYRMIGTPINVNGYWYAFVELKETQKERIST